LLYNIHNFLFLHLTRIARGDWLDALFQADCQAGKRWLVF